MSEGDFLSRWSRRKHAARRGEPAAETAAGATPAPPSSVAEGAMPPLAGSATSPLGASAQSPAAPGATPAALPAIESLTPESDFAPFMQPNVDGGVRRAALKTLFADPRFNVMDGLDVYIDDYSKPDPLPEGWLEKMEQVAHLGHYQPPPEAPEVVAAGLEAPGEATEPVVDPPLETPPAQESAQAASDPPSRS